MKLLDIIRKITAREMTSPLTPRPRSELDETIVAGLDPRKLARILKDSAADASDEFFRIAEEMEELDPHYRSVLSTRKLAITGIEPEVTAVSESAHDKEVAEFVKEIVEAPEFAELISDLLDGLGKGYSVVEIVWDTTGNRWTPVNYVWWHPSHFTYDRKSRQVVWRDPDGSTRPLEPFRFAVHVPKLKSGLPVRGALARMAAWCFLFKNYTMKDWVRFIEVFGMPIRIGKYSGNANEDDKRKLMRAVANIGSDAAAIIPASMSIEFVQAASGTAAQGPVFGQFADYLDRQISKGVLGQTMTADSGASKAQAVVHNEVRLDIKKADARQITMTLIRDLIIPAVALNFGPQDKYPKFKLPVQEPEDVGKWTDNVVKMMKNGLTVSIKQVREKLGADEPVDADDTLLSGSPANPDGGSPDSGNPGPDNPPPGKPGKKKAATSHLPNCPCCSAAGRATSGQTDGDEIDALVADALRDGMDDLDGLVEPVLALASRCKDFDAFVHGLSEIAGEQEAAALVDRLAPLMFMARGLGDVKDDPA